MIGLCDRLFHTVVFFFADPAIKQNVFHLCGEKRPVFDGVSFPLCLLIVCPFTSSACLLNIVITACLCFTLKYCNDYIFCIRRRIPVSRICI